MAQPSVAREPSMEEILASIRRIIESNEPEDAQVAGSSTPAILEPEEETTAADLQDTAAEDETLEANGDIQLTVDSSFEEDEAEETKAEPEPVAAIQPKSEVRQETAPRPGSLAEIAARVRAGAEAPATPSGANAAGNSTAGASAASSPLMTSRMQGMAAAGSAQPGKVEPAPKAPEPKKPEVAMEKTDAQVPGTAVAEVNNTPKHIVSEQTQDKVARSFDELAAALSAEPQRSLDEIAEEMLRPMLREWLDDNLPPLVERLVREEIERVARGQRS